MTSIYVHSHWDGHVWVEGMSEQVITAWGVSETTYVCVVTCSIGAYFSSFRERLVHIQAVNYFLHKEIHFLHIGKHFMGAGSLFLAFLSLDSCVFCRNKNKLLRSAFRAQQSALITHILRHAQFSSLVMLRKQSLLAPRQNDQQNYAKPSTFNLTLIK